MRIQSILAKPPYSFDGTTQFKRRTAREVWFIGRNKLICPRCQEETRMSRRYCDSCETEMFIPNPLFETLIRLMNSTESLTKSESIDWFNQIQEK